MSCGRDRGLGPRPSPGDLEGESIERLSGDATRSHSTRDLRREAMLRRVTTLFIAADTGRGTGTCSARHAPIVVNASFDLLASTRRLSSSPPRLHGSSVSEPSLVPGDERWGEPLRVYERETGDGVRD